MHEQIVNIYEEHALNVRQIWCLTLEGKALLAAAMLQNGPCCSAVYIGIYYEDSNDAVQMEVGDL